MTETHVEDCIIRRPAVLGYSSVHIIRNARVSLDSGRVDLMVLPTGRGTKLALVEVKRTASPDAAAKVVGQMIMYYTAALQLGLRGLTRIREFAAAHKVEAEATRNTSLNRLAGGASSQKAAWRLLQQGRKLEPREIDLFLALDSAPPAKLVDSLLLLKRNHHLHIRLLIANRDTMRLSAAV